MSTHGKYHIIEAETLDARKRHRALIEKALKSADLSPEIRNELMWELKQAVVKEYAAQKAVDEENDEEKRKKSDGGGDSDGQGSSSGSRSGGGSGFSEGDSENPDEGDLTDLEVFELLLFLAEHDTSLSFAADSSFDANADQALGAATLLFDRQEKIALIGESYALDTDNEHAAHAFLPSLEQHAAKLGARTLHVNVHHDAVELFRKFGYEIQSKVSTSGPGRKNANIQAMRKTLILHARPPGTEFI